VGDRELKLSLDLQAAMEARLLDSTIRCFPLIASIRSGKLSSLPHRHGFLISRRVPPPFSCSSRGGEDVAKPKNSTMAMPKKPPSVAPSVGKPRNVDESAGVKNGRENRSSEATKPPVLLALLRKIGRNTVKSLASFPLALVELAVIAALCAIGTVTIIISLVWLYSIVSYDILLPASISSFFLYHN
jgi:hypothetical protein